jgi:hypothetical protein
VLEETPDEFGTWILVLFVHRPRQEHLRFDTDEGGSHLQKFAGTVEITDFQILDSPQELLRDRRDRDIENIDILRPNEMKKQVERPLKPIELDEEEIPSFGLTLKNGKIHLVTSTNE